MSIQLTEKSNALFLAFANDAGNWSGTPLIGGNVEMTRAKRGNLSDLVQKGLVMVSDDGEGNTWVHFTRAGVDYANEHGVDLQWVLESGDEAPVAEETQVAATLAFIEAQTEEADLDEEADEGPATFIPAAPVFENGLEMDPAEGEAFEAPVADAPKPAKAKATPRAKLTLTDLDGNPVESRRAPSPETLALVLTLVEAFGGGKPFTNEAAAAIGFDEEALKRVFKRIKSWFGRDKVAHGKDGWVLSLRLQAGPDREEGVEEAAPAEAAA